MWEPDSLTSLRLLGSVRAATFAYRSPEHAHENAPAAVRLAVNVVVLAGDDGLVIFDPGPGDPSVWIDGLDEQTRRMDFNSSGGLFRFLNRYGGAEAVTAVVLTHHHPDHICALFTRDKRHERVFANATVFSPHPAEIERYCRAYLGSTNVYPVGEIPSSQLPFESFTCHEHCSFHTSYKVTLADGRCLVIWGDLLPTAMHLRPKFSSMIFEKPPHFYFPLMQESAMRGCLNLLSHDPRRRLVTLAGEGCQFAVDRVVEP